MQGNDGCGRWGEIWTSFLMEVLCLAFILAVPCTLQAKTAYANSVEAYFRTVPGMVTVSSDDLYGSGVGDLLDVIEAALVDVADGGTVSFADDLSGATLDLADELLLERNVTFVAPEGGLTLSGGGTHRVLKVGTGGDVTLDGFTIVSGDAGEENGGGICSEGTLTLVNCTVSNNVANGSEGKSDGGGIWSDGSLTLVNCTVSNNVSRGIEGEGGGDGGGICSEGTLTMTLTNCIMTDNRARRGGGIYSGENSAVSMSRCTFTRNYVGFKGGAVFIEDSLSTTISHCNFARNYAPSCGGGVFSKGYSSSMAIESCTFDRNSSSLGGGVCSSGALSVESCAFLGNRAGSRDVSGGGGICAFYHPLKVTNCTFAGNRSTKGAGMDIIFVPSFPSPEVTNCTFFENVATEEGGSGIWTYASGAEVTNCILWDEPLDDGKNSEIDGKSCTMTRCIVRGGIGDDEGFVLSGDLAAVSDDPRLLPPDVYGCTVTCGAPGHEVPLKSCAFAAGSSALDSGLALEDVPADQRGVTRPQGISCDIGAYEAEFYNIKALSSPGGSVSPDTVKVVIRGQNYTIAAEPDAGYRFAGWTGDVEGLTDGQRKSRVLTVSNVTRSLTLTATFAMDCHIDSDAFGIVDPVDCIAGRIMAREDGIPLDFRLSVEGFLVRIDSAAEGQILDVIDSEGRVKEGWDRIRPGDRLRVTAVDGSVSIYEIDAKYLICLEVGKGGSVCVSDWHGGVLEPDDDGRIAVDPGFAIVFTVRPEEKWRVDEVLYNGCSVPDDVFMETPEGYHFILGPVYCNGTLSAEFARQGPCPAAPVLKSPGAASDDCDLTPLLRTEAYESSGAGEHGETRWEIASDDAFTQVVFDVRTHRCLTEMRMGRDVLSPGRTYHWRVRFFDENGTPSTWSASRSFTTVEAKKAGLDNGVPSTQALSADEEIELPGEWDASNASADCKIFRGATEGEQIGIRAQAGSRVIEQAESLPKEALSDDMGTGELLELPRGLVSFRIKLDESDIAGSARVRVFFSPSLPLELHHWYKYSEADGWTDYTDRATFASDGSWVDLELRDGGEGDADGLANAVIVDPGGPGKSTIGDSGCGYGCDVFGSMPDAVLLLVPFAFLLGRKR